MPNICTFPAPVPPAIPRMIGFDILILLVIVPASIDFDDVYSFFVISFGIDELSAKNRRTLVTGGYFAFEFGINQ